MSRKTALATRFAGLAERRVAHPMVDHTGRVQPPGVSPVAAETGADRTSPARSA